MRSGTGTSPIVQLDHFFGSRPLNLGLASRNVTARSLKLVPSNDLMLLEPATIHVLLKLKSVLWVMWPSTSPDLPGLQRDATGRLDLSGRQPEVNAAAQYIGRQVPRGDVSDNPGRSD